MKTMDAKRQAVLYSVSAVVFMFAQWVISVALVRMGGFEDAGVFSLAMSIANLFLAVASYGIRNFQVSDVAHRFTQKQYLLARVVTIFVSYLVGILYLTVSGAYSPPECQAIFFYLVYVNANAFSDVLYGALQVKNKLYVNAYSYFAKGFLAGAGMLTAYAWRKDLVFALAVMALSSVLVTVLYDWREFRKEERMSLSVSAADITAIKKLLQKGFPLMLATLLPFAITAYPRQAIFNMLGKELLGIFSSLFTPTVLITTLIPSIFLAVVPRLAHAYSEKNKGAFIRMLFGCYGGVLLIMLLAEAAAAVMGRFFMRLLFGPEILEHYTLLYWAIIISGLNAMGSCGESALISMDRVKEPMFITAAGLAVLLIVTYPLVEHAGMMGAAVAWMLAYGVRAGLQVVFIGKNVPHASTTG